MDKGIDVEGIHGSVPINPNLLFKIIVTTFVTFIILLILVVIFYFNILTIDGILGIN
tara:strand:- start:832 stop:1002 length:171 start_codon:yes stop_codon:yes gene_type:complete